MKDENYWKDRYKDYWDIAADKEEKVRRIIEKECNCKCSYCGLGAGQTEYLSGSAKSWGYKKGGSDLTINGTNLYVEVTGPNVGSVGEDDPLWLRPDKIQNAIQNPQNDYWVVHVLKRNFLLRAIHIDDSFKKDYQKGQFEIVHPKIRGTRETYAEIPADSKYVVDISDLFLAIKGALKKQLN